ncbi:hypothetical protein CDAR_409621 [Caerostris darwini]|uniref:Uncharacterized protein n=1 Tax=Caerostris darwini TaxID=1538125 RepID=A0AAV4S364_9ARAC|nr:hypothetical protein CDAR_409621 [Caerostris darwini]
MGDYPGGPIAQRERASDLFLRAGRKEGGGGHPWQQRRRGFAPFACSLERATRCRPEKGREKLTLFFPASMSLLDAPLLYKICVAPSQPSKTPPSNLTAGSPLSHLE